MHYYELAEDKLKKNHACSTITLTVKSSLISWSSDYDDILYIYILINYYFSLYRITPSDLEGNPVPLKFVKFQNVQNIQLFIKDNQSGGDVTQIDHLAFYGSPISTTNMGEFKRVAGKKGESH